MAKELLSVCPSCNQIVFRAGRLELTIRTDAYGIFTLTTKCPHCNKIVKITINLDIKTNLQHDNA